MTDEQIKAYINATIRETVEAYKREGLLVDSKGAAYSDAAEMLAKYYEDGKTDNAITYAIQGLRFDPYFRIFELKFDYGMTNAEIAEELGVDISTVARNKRRLFVRVYDEVT